MRLTMELSEARANARIQGPLIVKLSDCINDKRKTVPLSSVFPLRSTSTRRNRFKGSSGGLMHSQNVSEMAKLKFDGQRYNEFRKREARSGKTTSRSKRTVMEFVYSYRR
jgi:hypothetical protein